MEIPSELKIPSYPGTHRQVVTMELGPLWDGEWYPL